MMTMVFTIVNECLGVRKLIFKYNISYYIYKIISNFSSLGIHITFRGNTGHGSRFIEKTAAEKLVCLLKVIKYKSIKLNDSFCLLI